MDENKQEKKNTGTGSGRGFAFNALTLAGSNTIAQVISVFASIILARLYSPAEMGIYTTYFSVLAVLTVISTLQYESAIVLSEDDKEASNVTALCIFVLGLIALVCALVITPLRNVFAQLLKEERLSLWLLFMPVSLVINGLTNIFTFSNVRKNNMIVVAYTTLIAGLLGAAFQIFFGLDSFHAFGGMILGHITGRGLATLILIHRSKRAGVLNEKPDGASMKALAKRYKRFPLYLVPSVFLDNLGASAPNLLLSGFFGSTVAGYYGLSYRLLSMPVTVIGGSLGQAFLPKAVEAKNQGNLADSAGNIFAALLRLGTTPIVLLAIVAPELISIVFGSEGYVSGQYVQWLCPWLLFLFLYSPLSNLFIVVEKQKQFMFFNAAVLIVRIVSLAVGGFIGSDFLAIALCGISGAAVSFAGCLYVLSLSGVNILRSFAAVFAQVLRTVPFTVPAIAAKIAGCSGWVSAGVAILSGCLFLLIEGKAVLALLKRQNSEQEA